MRREWQGGAERRSLLRLDGGPRETERRATDPNSGRPRHGEDPSVAVSSRSYRGSPSRASANCEERRVSTLSIRLDLGPGIRVGPGKIRLLELVAEHGSISAAGRALGMSYRRAWLLLDELNRELFEPVIAAAPGGRSGGGAILTPFGSHLVAAYRAIERDAAKVAARYLAGLTPPAETAEVEHPST